ncbi:MAG TPA: hypothetical protein PKW21_04640, partial [Rhabdaerophilum sp.]|nr:hypothetical protein [Rhabdaerophilum sp.]
ASLTRARVSALHHGINIEDYVEVPANAIPLNGIGVATIDTETEIHAAPYRECQPLGSLLLIDPLTNEALALGVIESAARPAPALVANTASGTISATLLRMLVPADIHSPEARATQISWRLASALIVGLFAGFITGSASLALVGISADLLLRTAGRTGHDRLWRAARARRRSQEMLGLDGGGI